MEQGRALEQSTPVLAAEQGRAQEQRRPRPCCRTRAGEEQRRSTSKRANRGGRGRCANRHVVLMGGRRPRNKRIRDGRTSGRPRPRPREADGRDGPAGTDATTGGDRRREDSRRERMPRQAGGRASKRLQQAKWIPGGPQRSDPQRRIADGRRTTAGGGEQWISGGLT